MATYTIEDIVIELIIQLPPNYPLGSIAVGSGRRVGVAVQQWRNWMLQLSTYLTHQVGFQLLSCCGMRQQNLKYISLLEVEWYLTGPWVSTDTMPKRLVPVDLVWFLRLYNFLFLVLEKNWFDFIDIIDDVENACY